MDLLFCGGTVLTQDPAQPVAEALAVRGGRILAVGGEAEVRVQASADAEVVDLAGRCLLPGFHDSHVHLGAHGFALAQLHLEDTHSVAEALSRVAARVRELPPGSWLLGTGFLLSRWGAHAPQRAELDRAAPEHPVLLRSQDHHSAWANGRALELAGVSAATPDPEGGVIVRDAAGEPSGLLLEGAQALVARAVPEPSAAETREAIWRAGRHLASLGVTTVHHMAYQSVAEWRQPALAASDERFPLRVWACIDEALLEHAAALGLATGQGGSTFQVGGAKFFADGALGSLTARMLEPYAGSERRGMALLGAEAMLERFALAIRAGLTPVVHAIGDAAVRGVLDALEATRELWQPLDMRPRIEHVQHLHPEDAPRLSELGVIASVQPVHLRFDAPRIRELLPERLARAHAWRSLSDNGAVLALGSDTPVASPDVLLSLHTATTREDEAGERLEPGQALTLDQALAGHTCQAAYAIHWEGRSGRLRPGFDADLALLSHDPHEGLADLAVEATLKGGAWTYRQGEAEVAPGAGLNAG